jgi:hypothetical protein
LLIHCKGIIHGPGTSSYCNLMLGQLALLHFLIAEAQLGNRKDLAFEAAPNQLSRISLPPMRIRAKYALVSLKRTGFAY